MTDVYKLAVDMAFAISVSAGVSLPVAQDLVNKVFVAHGVSKIELPSPL